MLWVFAGVSDEDNFSNGNPWIKKEDDEIRNKNTDSSHSLFPLCTSLH